MKHKERTLVRFGFAEEHMENNDETLIGSSLTKFLLCTFQSLFSCYPSLFQIWSLENDSMINS